jgi:degradative hydroxymethylglutaryl-CoA reductase
MSDDQRRIPEFYKLSVEERVRAVHERGLINTADFRALSTGEHTLGLDSADKMIENVVGVMGMPLGLGMNMVVNERQYIVPMVVEEPSVVAALGSACKLIRSCGGFKAEATDPILIGQIQIVNLPNMEKRKRRCASASKKSSTLPTACTRTWWPAAAARATSSCSCIRCRRARSRCSSFTCSSTRATRWARISSTACAKA